MTKKFSLQIVCPAGTIGFDLIKPPALALADHGGLIELQLTSYEAGLIASHLRRCGVCTCTAQELQPMGQCICNAAKNGCVDDRSNYKQLRLNL